MEKALEMQGIIKKMGDLTFIKSEDEISNDQLKITAVARIIQSMGSLYKYNGDLDKNIMVAKDCFFCLD